MVFSSTIFIFFFLPLALAGYYLLPSVKWKNTWLLIASLFFYFWGGYAFFPVILWTIFLNYAGGRLLEAAEEPETMQKAAPVRSAAILGRIGREKVRKGIFTGIILLNLLNFVYWKYTGFFLQTIRDITGLEFVIPEIMLPIGISFFTFQGMSYVIDVYRKNVPVQKNILKLGLYIALFPQLIAGPIVRYSDIQKQLETRRHSIDDFAEGIRIFTIGLAKKAVISNSMAITADAVFELPPYQHEVAVAWIGAVFYTLQLYFDFSGYSDMAVGLGRMFGFRFSRNFDYPFISTSVAEMWRRWHISLSSWFRDYVYIPMGGSRRGNVYLHLFIVFALTGFWHGAAWNYVVWGLFWGVAVVAERFLTKCFFHGSAGGKTDSPGKLQVLVAAAARICRWAFTMLLWIISMVIFRTDTPAQSVQYLKVMFGLTASRDVGFSLSYYINRYEIFILLLGLAAMLPAGKACFLRLKEKLPENGFICLQNIVTLALFGISVIYVVTGTYNPFIYFQF